MNTAAKKTQARTRSSFKEKFKRRFDIWLLQHAQAFAFSFGEYIRNPISNLLTTAVIGISLTLSAGFYLLIDNMSTAFSDWDDSLQITLFLKNEITDDQSIKLANQLTKNNKIGQTNVIKRADALAEYQRLSGFIDALDVLNENPFPNVIIVKPALNSISEIETKRLIKQLRKIPEINNVQYDSYWIKRLFSLLDIIDRALIILSVLLAIAVLLIIGNTIRLGIYSRRAEIEVNKLFGGTDNFIQRPFLYAGFWYGAFGGLIAWMLITAIVRLLHGPVEQLANLYTGHFELIGLDLIHSLILLGIGIFLGLSGSWISVKCHLHTIEPI